MYISFFQSSNNKVEREIISWVNERLEGSGKESRITSFQDSKISSALPVIDLIDAIKPGVINYELLQEGGNYEVRINIRSLNNNISQTYFSLLFAKSEDFLINSKICRGKFYNFPKKSRKYSSPKLNVI